MKGDEYVGKIVEWISHGNTSFNVKRGVVIEYIPKNTPIQYKYEFYGKRFPEIIQRSRLLINVNGHLYTPIGNANGEFLNVRVVEQSVNKKKVIKDIDTLFSSLNCYLHDSTGIPIGNKIAGIQRRLEELKAML